MAHNVEISALINKLIKAEAKAAPEADVERYQRAALRAFAAAPTGRVNQFEVAARLDGLVEKSMILNNDPLADALRDRLAELSARSGQWTPDILSLLLDLSDRPVHNTNVDDLFLLKPTASPLALTWSEILEDDPLDNQDGIWNNVDFGADGSDEDEILGSEGLDGSEHTTDLYLPDSESFDVRLEKFIQPLDDVDLREIVDAQYWKQHPVTSSINELKRDTSPELILTELQTVREVIFMLLGLPTSIFNLDDTQDVPISSEFSIRHVSQGAFTTLLGQFAEIGRRLGKLRSWSRRSTVISLEQTFQSAIGSRLRDVDHSLSEMQANFLRPNTKPMPSLLQLLNEVCNVSRPIQQVYDILVESETTSSANLTFAILEHLFDRSCVNQSIGDEDGYKYMAKLFFECFQTYLKPVQYWMEHGLLSNPDQMLFIGKRQEDVPLGSIWQSQYHLIHDTNANLHAPKFLHVAAKKIFNTGKSVIFLKHLGHEEDNWPNESSNTLAMNYESVCQPAELGMIGPFAELFDMAFDAWIASKHHSSSLMLRTKLDSECGLKKSLDALDYIYFFRNGALSTTMAFKLFDWMNRGDREWRDDILLTELFQETFNAVSCIEPQCLEVRSVHIPGSKNHLQTARSMAALQNLGIFYTLPWPVANIVRAETLAIRGRVFVFLLQIRRAKYLLQKHGLRRNTAPTFNNIVVSFYRLHHQLQWFTDTILTYTNMVLSATSIEMRLNMKRAEDVDAMIEIHEAYISQVQHRCLLSKAQGPIHQAIVSVLDLTILLSDISAVHSSQPNAREKGSRMLHTARTPAQRQNTNLDSDEDEDGDELDGADDNSISNTALANTDQLDSVSDTFKKLHSYILAAVQEISKADSASCWEILNSSLAVGVR